MTEKKQVAVLGMMCASCAANVERKLNATEGVISANVNLPTRTAYVEFDPEHTSLQQMKEALSTIGYDLVIEEDRNVEVIEQREYSKLQRKVILSWLFALTVTGLSMGWFEPSMTDSTRNQLCLIIALLNMAYCGRQFYTTAIRQLLHGSASMDTLVALSTAISFLFSTFNTFWGEQVWTSQGIEPHTYFDASVMIVTFVLTGRLLEERAKKSTASSIRSLMGLQPKTAHLVSGENKAGKGQTVDIPISAVQPGDLLMIYPGEKIPVDGTLVSLSINNRQDNDDAPTVPIRIDESMMTGEAFAVEKNPGDHLLAGTIVKSGMARMRAEAVGQKTVLSNMIRMVQEAQGSKAPVQHIVDRIALFFVPSVVALSLLTFALWLLIGGPQTLPHAILSAVSVLVIACPCAMGLATPTALMVGIGKAAEQQILIKDATALEELRRVDAMVVDKTGTITYQTSKKVAEESREEESLKPYMREVVSDLKSQGIALYLMSGDKEACVSHWANEAGIEHYQSQVLPQDKENLVRQLQEAGHHVAMVGDGINDSQALAAADVSIAMGRGTDVAMDVAQITLTTDDMRRIPMAINLSRRTVSMIHQNLFWAFIYNLVCIPLAAGLPFLFGYEWQITPMVASVLMAFSSVSVVLNSLRLKFSAA